MSTSTVRPLLDRPFHRDRLVQLAAGVAAVIVLLSLPRFVEPGGAYNPDRAWGLLSLLAQVSFWLWLLLLMVPAWWRRRARRRRAGNRPAVGTRSWASSEPSRSGAVDTGAWGGVSGDAWGSASAGVSGAWPAGAPPVFRSVTVSPSRIVAGSPVTITWDAPGAEQVAVGGRTGLPPTGTTTVVPDRDGPLSLVAVNSHGTAAATTMPAVDLEPGLALHDVPRPPAAPAITWSPSAPPTAVVRSRLDAVVDRQRLRRQTAVPALAPGPAAPTVTPSTDIASRREH